MPPPIITIVTPLYNRAWCVSDCVASAGVTGLPVEMIIVDDGSTDASVAEARATVRDQGLEDQVRIVEQNNAGPSVARNRAAGLARGEWLVFLDSDDLWFPWTAATMLDVLSGLPPTVELVFASGRNFFDTSELSAVGPEQSRTEVHPSFVRAVQENPAARYGACNAAMRRDAFLRMGGFSAELRCAEDTDLFLRTKGEVAFIRAPVLVALRRSGHDSLTGNIPEAVKGFEWMRHQQGSGAYPGTAEDLQGFLARSCAYTIRAAFAAGYIRQAYSLYLSNLALLANPRTRKYLLRLPLTPLLHLYKPQAYPFRRAPVGRSG